MRKQIVSVSLVALSLITVAHADLRKVTIKKVSDGFNLIRKDGFDDLELSKLKKMASAGEELRIERTVQLPPSASVDVAVDVSGGKAYLMYYASGEIGNKDSSFDLSYSDVKHFAGKLGIGSPSGHEKSTDGLNWKWELEGFKCSITISATTYASRTFWYQCKYK